jgi:hypothetical protein
VSNTKPKRLLNFVQMVFITVDMANKWSKKFKNYLNNAALLAIGLVLFLLAAFIFEALGLIEGSGNPAMVAYQIFWAVAMIVGTISIAYALYVVFKNLK